jgi:multiple sugar transport system substrate-binding protein
MKRHLQPTAAFLAAAMLLAACGGNGAEPGGDEATGGDGEATLTFWDNQQADTGLSEFQRTAIEEFEEAHPDISVEVETVPYADYQQRLTLAVEGGNPPDIATLDQIWQAQFADAGAVIPLDDYVAESESVTEDNFFPGAWESALWDGQVWGVPFNVDVWQFTYYNQALLEEAGVDPSQLETWEGLTEAAEALTGDGQYGVGLFGQAYESLTVVMNSFVFSNGGEIIDADGVCRLDEPEAIEALEYLASLAPYAPEGVLGASNEDMRELFLNETLATEWWPALEQPTLQDSDVDWGFAVGTAPEGQTPIGTYGGWNLAIFEGAENPDAAWQFIEFLTDPEVNPRVVDLVPANVEAAESFLTENRDEPELVLEHLENARPRPLAVEYLQISEIQMQMMQQILDGASASEAAGSACDEIDALT